MGSSSSSNKTSNTSQLNDIYSNRNYDFSAAQITSNTNTASSINIRRTAYPSNGYGYPSNAVPSTSSPFGTGTTIVRSTSTTSRPSGLSSNDFSVPARQIGTMPTISQTEQNDIAKAIQLSLRENYATRSVTVTRTVGNVRPTTSIRTPITFLSCASSQRQNNNIKQDKLLPKTTAPKGEMTFDCNICMEINENDDIVATECGHMFHRECVSPWIRQAGNCPTCRVRITTVSLRKIFISVKTNAASTSNPTNTRKNDNTIVKNTHRTGKNRNSLLPVMFTRSIWLGSQDKNLTEQSLKAYILQRFNLTLQKISIKSLKKLNTTQPQRPIRYVSFKINVDSEDTFNNLLDISKWPRTYRVREFIERN